MKKYNGFTLIELLVVVLIIGILAAIALPQYNKAVEKSRLAEAFTMIDAVQKSIDLYVMENGYDFYEFIGHPWTSGVEVPFSVIEPTGFTCDTWVGGQGYCRHSDFAYKAGCSDNSPFRSPRCHIMAFPCKGNSCTGDINDWNNAGDDIAYELMTLNKNGKGWVRKCIAFSEEGKRLCASLPGWDTVDGWNSPAWNQEDLWLN